MSIESTNTQFKAVITNKSGLQSTAVSNGCVYFVDDTKELFFDFDSTRVEVKDILILNTDAQRTNILFNPLNKFYFVLETQKLWLYKDGTWYQLSGSVDLSDYYTKSQVNALIPSTTDMVTTNTTQNITGEKTFVGDKRIKFKQSTSTNKLGFTLYNNSSTELGGLEYNPSSNILTLNAPKTGNTLVGFRYWSGSNSNNIIIPKPSSSGDFYIPLSFKNGSTTVTTDASGVANLSTLMPNISGKADKSTTLSGYGITDAYTKTEVDSKLSAVYKFKGTVESIDSLPSSGNIVGDVYNVEDTGANYAWTESGWDKLSETIDLSGLQEKITTTNKLDADLVDDSSSTHKFVSASEKSTWNNKQNAIEDLADIRTGAEAGATAVQPSAISDMATKTWVGNQGYLTSHQDISGKANIEDLAEVAFSGSYDDLENKPTIPTVPTNVSAFTNDAGYLTSHQDISGKVDKIPGKGLSTEDYTTSEKEKLAGLSNYTLPTANANTLGGVKIGNNLSMDPNGVLSADAQPITVDSALSDSSENPVQNKIVKGALDGKADSIHTHTKAQITDFPSIPSKTSELTNDSGFLTSHQDISGKANTEDLADVAFSGDYNDLDNKPTIPSAVTESTVSGWGFTKNTGTITGIKMNGSSKGTSGIVDLGTVITSHQDISGKANTSDLATVATSGDYNDLDNLPTIPSAQVNSDWNATSGKAQILNKPSIPSKPSDIGAASSSHTHTSANITDLNSTISSAISGKADSATTLSGYGITDAYTKTEINGMVSAGMHYKGTKASYSALPSTGNAIGDLWNVTDTGANYAWNGATWDKLSETIDLSSYELKSNVTSKGSATQPVWFDADGVATPCTYSLNKSVPSSAVFTDTNTLVQQDISTTNNTYPILATPTANASSNQGAKTAIFSSKTKINPSTGEITANGLNLLDSSNNIITISKSSVDNHPIITYDESFSFDGGEIISENLVINSDLATVARSGSYDDLINKPTTTSSVTSGSSAALTSGGAYTNLITKVEAGTTANVIKVTKAGSTASITINNVANAVSATSANSIITKDGTTAYQWIGTTAQYNIGLNNGTITNTTLCIITDD